MRFGKNGPTSADVPVCFKDYLPQGFPIFVRFPSRLCSLLGWRAMACGGSFLYAGLWDKEPPLFKAPSTSFQRTDIVFTLCRFFVFLSFLYFLYRFYRVILVGGSIFFQRDACCICLMNESYMSTFTT